MQPFTRLFTASRSTTVSQSQLLPTASSQGPTACLHLRSPLVREVRSYFTGLLAFLFAVAAAHQAVAASAQWNGTTDAAWATGTNWSATPVPGTGDTATFNNVGGAVDTIDLGAGVTIAGILFDTSSVAAYTIGSGAAGSQTLTLNNSGTIVANNTINANQLFNAKLVLGTDATGGSYTITNNDLSNTLTFAGAISGFSTGGTRTLNVKTANQTGVITLSGAITDGGASNSLALNFSAVSGDVGMTMGNTGNTYSGGTTIGTGVRLQVNAGAGKGLGTGDVTVASNGQAYLNSAGTYANNFAISGTGGTSGGSLGAIRISATGSNIISGNVTLNADSTLGVDSGRTATISGNITGAFNLTKTSTGAGTGSPLTLSGTNGYTGTTTITNGVISFAKKASLYNSDTAKWIPSNLIVASGAGLALGVGDSASGYWDAAGVTDFLGASQMGTSTTTTGFKTGSLLGFDTTNATAGSFTYNTAIGNVGGGTNVTGLLKLGTGTLVLGGTNTYSGATQVDAGTLNLASTGAISCTTLTVGAGATTIFSNTGGTATFSGALSVGQGGVFSQSSGTSSVSSASSGGSADGGLISITGGDFTVANNLSFARTSFSTTGVPSLASPLAASTTLGLYVNGASAVVNAGTLSLGTANSNASARVGAGSLTVTGAVTLGKYSSSSTRYSVLQVDGGTFSAADTTNGIVIAPNNGTNTGAAEAYFSGGTSTVGKIAFGSSADTKTGTGWLILGGGTLYVGSGGIVKASTTSGADAYSYTIGLNSGTLAAAANWSSPLNMTLGTNPTIQAADSSGTARNITLSGILSGTGFTKSGAGTLELSGINTYTGTTTVRAGTLTLSGARTASSGAITVADTAGTDATLNIQNGTLALVTNTSFIVGNAATTAATATVNQSGGAVSFTSGATSNGLLLANAGVAGSASIYNLSGGSITTFASATRGIILGTNSDKGSSTFNLSGPSVLNMTAASGGGGDAILQIGRSDSAASNTSNLFNQTGGTANVGILAMGGKAGGATGVISTLTLTGGTFSANQFTVMGAGNTNAIAINIGGSADVTLPAFPTTALGTSSTATINFDGGTLRPGVTSTNYLGSISSAFIKAGGANFDVASAKDITITQNLSTHATSTGGGLTKSGAGALTLSVANTYTGGTALNAGTIQIGHANALGTTGTISFGGGTLQYGTGITTDLSSRFSTAASQAYKIDTNGNDVTLATGLTSSGGSLSKCGTATLSLAADNTFTGATDITGTGAIVVSGSGKLSGTSGITVTGGSLLIGASEVIKNEANISLGGTLGFTAAAEAATETLGALTLTANSILDFGNANAHIFSFGTVNLNTFTLSVYNWSGTPRSAGGNSRFIPTGTPDNLSQISFYSGVGTGLLGTGMMAGGEIVPVPEPSTILVGALLLGGLAFAERKRLKRISFRLHRR